MTEARRKFNRMEWWKHLWPRTLYSLYRTERGHEFCIWRQWLGLSYDIRRFPIGDTGKA